MPFGPIADAVARIISWILDMVQVLVFASILISWVGADPSNQIVQVIRNMTEPMFRPLRRLTKNIPGPLDLAPLLVLIIIMFLQYGVVPYIRMLGGAPVVG